MGWMIKSESLDARLLAIHEAFSNIHDSYSKNLDLPVVEIFDEFVVVFSRAEKTHYKVPYTGTDKAYEFSKQSEWEEVRLQKDWVTKFFYGGELTEDDVIPLDYQEPDSRYAIKALGGQRVGGYAMLWGDEETPDLTGEWFTPETRDTKAIFECMGALPFIVHHAADDKIKTFVAGKVDILEEDEFGLWWEAAVDQFAAYKEYVAPLLDNDMAFTSTGTLPAAKRVTKTGEITRWPIAEVSATWTPAEWRMMERPISEVKSYFVELGVDTDPLEQYDEAKKSKPVEKQQDGQGAAKARLEEALNLELALIKLTRLTGDL